VLIDAWGFLAVFFAAIALHQTELKLIKNRKKQAKADRSQLQHP
jgi:hypothetical protein